MKKERAYYFAADGLRALAILAVVAIHTTTKTLGEHSMEATNYVFPFFVNQATRFAVPLFFMISGFVLEANYAHHQSYWSYLKKRTTRILVPYLVWSLIYYFVVNRENIPLGLTLLRGEASYQLYFIPALLILYIIFPLLHRLYGFIANKSVFLLLFSFQLLLLWYEYYVNPPVDLYPVNMALLNFFVFLAGVVAARNTTFLQKLNRKRVLLGLLAVFFGIAVFFEGRGMYLSTHNYLYYYSSWRPTTLLYTLAVGAFCYPLLEHITRGRKIIEKLSKLSFFVFFVHVGVLEILWTIVFHALPSTVFFEILFYLTVVTISWTLAFFVHKVPNLSRITG